MVFKHNKLPFDFRLAFEYTSQLDCGGQFTSARRHIPEKRHFPDEVRPDGEQEFGKMTAVTSNDNNTLDNTTKLSWVVGNNGEPVSSETSKRPFGDDVNLQLAAKRSRQTEVNAAEGFKSCSHLHEDTRLDPLVRLSFFPGYFEDHHGPIACNEVLENQLSYCNYLPRKLVAIGPDHQAEIPMWRDKNFQNSLEASTSSVQIVSDDDRSSDKWIAHCITPIPVSNSLGFKTDCHCLDEGSIRCVRHHVMEAREELRSTLGHEQFAELGLCEMGEDVAFGWTEEEEHLFSEVIISNPASMGKNFWDDLPRVFPHRSKIELVSYYFNVFMLRKRAEQNRTDPLDVDSDNDEWQGVEDEEDNSGVESASEDDNVAYRVGEANIHDEAEGVEIDNDDEFGSSDGVLPKSTFGPDIHRMGVNLDQDVHDDSCTSYEGQHNGCDSSDGGRADVFEGDQWNLRAGQDFVVGHCDPKTWDIGYRDLDLLPTCNVIEEVFGNESSDNDNREGNGVS